MHPAQIDRIVWQLKSFFGAQIKNVADAEVYANKRHWDRIVDPEILELTAPNGKLPFDYYAP